MEAMKIYESEVNKRERKEVLFYYPYEIKLKSEYAKKRVAGYFYSSKTSYVLGMKEKDIAEMLNEENMKMLAGEFPYYHDDPRSTERSRVQEVKEQVKRKIGRKGVSGFINYLPHMNESARPLNEGEDFEIIVGKKVKVKRSKKATFEGLPTLTKENEY